MHKRWRKGLAASILLILPLFFLRQAQANEEETELANRLSTEATQFLDQLLGPGRARVVINVQGEKSETRSQSELTAPIHEKILSESPAPSSLLPGMPGYVDDPEFKSPNNPAEQSSNAAATTTDIVQKTMEQTLRVSGLTVKKMQVSVVLDKALSENEVNVVRQVLPDFLHMNGDRGDILVLLRAPLKSPLTQTWFRLMMTTEGMRFFLRLAGVLVMILWLSALAYLIAIRVVKTFVQELAAMRHAAPETSQRITTIPTTTPIPEIMPGDLPGLDEEAGVGAGREKEGLLTLGSRFDFLESRTIDETARLIAQEPPSDLAGVFAQLAGHNPNLATRLFSALPSRLQADVSRELVRLTSIDPEKLSAIEARLRDLIELGVQGPERMSQILNRLPPEKREEIMGSLISQDRTLVERLETFLYPFERLVDLTNDELRRLVKGGMHQEWALALRGAPDGMVEKILELLPEEARARFNDAIQTPQPKDRVLQARSRILTLAFGLEAKGQLSLKRSGYSKDLI